MQQTKNYKLNLIETSDTFSPAPLNENAQKTEAALDALGGVVAGIDLRPCLIKLGEFACESSPFTFRLPEGLDLTQYRALVLMYWLSGGACVYLTYNGGVLMNLLNQLNAAYLNGAGWGVIMPAGGYVYAMSQAGAHNGTKSVGCSDGGRIKADWAALDGEFTVVNCGSNSRITLYGLRA